MKALNMSAAKLARAIGVSPQAVGKIIRGDTSDPRRLTQMARELLTSTAYLTGETDDHSISAAELAFDQGELELLEMFRSLEPESRETLTQLVRIMAQSARTPAVHSKRAKFVGPTETQLLIAPAART